MPINIIRLSSQNFRVIKFMQGRKKYNRLELGSRDGHGPGSILKCEPGPELRQEISKPGTRPRKFSNHEAGPKPGIFRNFFGIVF